MEIGGMKCKACGYKYSDMMDALSHFKEKHPEQYKSIMQFAEKMGNTDPKKLFGG